MQPKGPKWRACGPDGWVAPVANIVSDSPIGYPHFVEINTGVTPAKCVRVPGEHIIAMGDSMIFLNLTAAQLDEMCQHDMETWPRAA